MHNPEEEPVCDEPFDWSIDGFKPTAPLLRELVFKEALKFHPN